MMKDIFGVLVVFLIFDYSQGVIYTHHLISREQLVNQCFQRYISMVETQCTYPKQEYPCLKGTEKDKNGQVYHPYKLETIALRCCLMRCSEYDVITTYCCTERNCMKKCYDIDIPETSKNFYFFGKK